MTPLDYAHATIETTQRKYKAADLPPAHHFHYHQGVFLSGVYQTYLLDGRESEFDYMKDWVDSNLTPDGKVLNQEDICLDDIMPGILIFPIYERTGDERYRHALDFLTDEIDHYRKNDEGGFWHRTDVPRQMWLDGLYMGGPFMTEYGRRFNRPDMIDEACKQALLMREKTEVKSTGLWRHVYDPDRVYPFSDPETGLSPEYWGRSVGWVPVALLDDLDNIPEDHPDRPKIIQALQDLLTAVCKYQGPDGRWWQVLDKVKQAGNWPENSCSSLFVAAIAKAVRLGLLDESYLEQAKRGYQGVIDSLKWQDTTDKDGSPARDLLIGDVCIGTGPGTYQDYCDRPTSVNDLHGLGAFLLMCAQMQRILDQE
ncbi:unsaturated rhamnogalacturonyl hydrolase YteR [Bombiscardovia nodaiensis]|uniref:Unsaturated rhamnogalacturonyl hydrolase YteR n=1 Tax=Bombiscardovia nodaiensis TaxID=2932181 RepID=A0ABM8B5N9_9BIFI|nr:unsaturated rhamnogalacturonyl hydrolase YteR [Bombiscardovia nodaiensis]